MNSKKILNEIKTKNKFYRQKNTLFIICKFLVSIPIIALGCNFIIHVLSLCGVSKDLSQAIIIGILVSLASAKFLSSFITEEKEGHFNTCCELYSPKIVNQYLKLLEKYNGQIIYDYVFNCELKRIPNTDEYLMLCCDVKFKKVLQNKNINISFIRKTNDTFNSTNNTATTLLKNLAEVFVISDFDFFYVNDECDFNNDNPTIKNYIDNFDPKAFIQNLQVKNSENTSVIDYDKVKYSNASYEFVELNAKILPRYYSHKEQFKIEFNFEFPIEAESYFYIPIDLPTCNFNYKFDFKNISDSHDVSAKAFFDAKSGFEPNLRLDNENYIKDDINTLIYPKGGITFIWWKKPNR